MSYLNLSQPPEPPEDDAPRVNRAVRAALLGKLNALAHCSIPAGSRDRQDVIALRQRVEQDSAALTQKQQDRVAQLMWKYRRQMPRGIAPKLNPADPIVRENAAKELAHVG